MGEVYEAWDLRSERAVALKTVRASRSDDSDERLRLLSEVHLARKVDGLQYRLRRAERLKGIAERVKVNEVVPDEPLPPVPTPAAAPKTKTSRRWLVAGAVAVAVLVGGLLAIFLTGNGSADSTIAANASSRVAGAGRPRNVAAIAMPATLSAPSCNT